MSKRDHCDICGARYVMATSGGVSGQGSTKYMCPNAPHTLARLKLWIQDHT